MLRVATIPPEDPRAQAFLSLIAHLQLRPRRLASDGETHSAGPVFLLRVTHTKFCLSLVEHRGGAVLRKTPMGVFACHAPCRWHDPPGAAAWYGAYERGGRGDNPASYIRVVASLLPRHAHSSFFGRAILRLNQ
jgi:hypothetical protein